MHEFLRCDLQVESVVIFKALFEALVHGKQTGLLKDIE